MELSENVHDFILFNCGCYIERFFEDGIEKRFGHECESGKLSSLGPSLEHEQRANNAIQKSF